MTIAVREDLDVRTVVQAAVERHGATREELVAILSDVNREVGYIPAEAFEEVSRLLRIPKAQLFSVASFYKMLAIKPRGRHVIQFCESAPCHVVGGGDLWRALREELGLEPGETSADGRWTLVTTSCIGLCGVGPVIVVDDDVYGNVTPEQLPEILARYE